MQHQVRSRSIRFTLVGLLVAALGGHGLRAQDPPAGAEPESWRLAVGLLQRGLHAEAAVQLRAFLKAEPRHARASEARYRLGVCELETGRPEAAIEVLEQAARDQQLALRPECLYRLGLALQTLARHADAAKRFEELLAAIPSDHYLAEAAAYAAGECRRDAGDDARAIPHFERASRSADADPSGYAFAGAYQAGYARLRTGDHAGAQAAFRALCERWPTHEAIGELQYLVGETAHRVGDTARAETAWRAAAAAGGDWADDARSGLATLARARGDDAAAAEELRRIAKADPASPLGRGARVQLAQFALGKGEASRAVAELDALLAEEGLEASLAGSAHALRGDALAALGRPGEAVPAYDAALSQLPEARRPRLACARAEALLAAGQAAEALAAFVATKSGGDAGLRGELLYGELRALHALGRHDESIARAQVFARELPQHRLAGHAGFALAENQYAARRYREARSGYDAIPADHALAPAARHKAAWSAWLSDDAPDALQRFAALVEDGAQDAERREEALAMTALAAAAAKQAAPALDAADRYAARHPQGAFLARTERVAARVLREKGDLGAARERLARAAKAERGEGAVGLALERADLAFQAGDFAQARRGYEEHAGRPDAYGARALEGLAWCAFELGDDEACLRAIRGGLAHATIGDIAPALRELELDLFARKQRWPEAIEAARAFLNAWPKHAKARDIEFALGTALARAGQDDEARTVLTRVVEAGAAKRADLALYELGWIAQRKQDQDGARARFAQVVTTTAEPELADECRVLVAESELARGKRDAARAVLAKVTNPSQIARARYLVAQSLLAEGKDAEAARLFAEVATLPGADALAADALFAAGETELQRGEFVPATASLETLLAKHPKHARVTRAKLYLGECFVRAGRSADALPLLEQYLAQDAAGDGDAGRARARLWLGKAQLERKDFERAERELAEAARLADGAIGAEAAFQIGESRRARADLEGAAEAYLKVAILFADPVWVPRALLAAGKTWLELGQREKADRVLDELIEKHPKSAEAAAAKPLRRSHQR
ncbi:MAG: tetratricopeptide repeat protein [Planctomycetes bacterium]|nr:tetratricopeptide repeat protein [Planctomycetota bacterium]